ncbi:lasso peptide biosynthesis B2 protein [Salmonella enterica]|nr:lasso peptide biosynthesis B2 protein [Salmonella enterica]ECD9475857.1 lasso peptide biosynthesis B2 protein [Salmonella enterica subsp. houtenae]HDC2132807.1 lasso peptide biosynthesis B2 protein [Salmonella enterica]
MTSYCLTSYGKDLIILDIKKDEFSLLPGAGDLLEEREQLLDRYPETADYFASEYFIGSANRHIQDSFLEERWFLPDPDKVAYKLSLPQRLKLLLKILYYSKNIEKKGMAWIFRREERKKFNNWLPQQDINNHIRKELSLVSTAFHMNIFKSDCLTYSYTLKKMLNVRRIDARLVIGVRTQPFYSHSWVEVSGRVINDDPDIRDKLSVIAEI